MIKIKALGHISVVVADLEQAIEFYQQFLGAEPQQRFNRLHNEGLNKGAGFLKDPQQVEISICFLSIPSDEPITLELMQYHNPEGRLLDHEKRTNDRNILGHISLSVEDVAAAFEHVKSLSGLRFISSDPAYSPQQISKVCPEQFNFFDSDLEQDAEQKQGVCDYVESLQFFYCVDPYGIQWELEGQIT